MNYKFGLIIPENLLSADEKYDIDNLSTQSSFLKIYECSMGPNNSIEFFGPHTVHIIIDLLEAHPFISYIVGREIFDPLYDKVLRPVVVKLATAIKSKSIMIFQANKKPKLVDIYIEIKLSKGTLVTAVSPDVTEEEFKEVFIELVNARHTLEKSNSMESRYLLMKDSSGNFTLMSDKEYIASKCRK